MKPTQPLRRGSYTLRQIECFVAVADAGSIARAAPQLHLSESAVADALRGLESAFGTTLLLRQRARGITLTSEGLAMLRPARELLHQSDQLVAALRHGAGEVSGVVRVGAVESLAAKVLPFLLATMRREFPAIEVRYTIADQHELIGDLREGSLDVLLAFDIDVSSDLPRQTLYGTRATVVVHTDHALAERDAVELREFGDEPMVLLDVSPGVTLTLELMGRAGVRPQIVHRVTDVELCRSMVGQGLGYSLLMWDPNPQLTWDGNRVRHLRIVPDPPVIDIVALWRDDDPSPPVRSLLHTTVEVRTRLEAVSGHL